MQPGVTRACLVAGQAAAYADPAAHAGTALVLAAGNVASLGPRDVLSKLFVEGKVVVMKANPVNDYLVPHWNRALAALVEAGVLRIVDGGAAVGEYLTAPPADRRGPHHRLRQDLRRRRLRHRRRGRPAQGGRRARARQAGHGRARQRVAGHRGAGQVVGGRPALPGRARGHHAGQQRRLQLPLGPRRRDPRRLAPARGLPRCADPDAGRDHDPPRLLPGRRRTATTPSSPPTPRPRSSASGPADALPWTFIRNVPPGHTDDICFNVESFFGEVAETALTAPRTPAAFVDAAVAFCNDVVWGTLGCTVLASPASLKVPDGGRRGGAGHRRPALRRHRGQRLARRGLRPGLHHLGRLPGPPAHRHPVRLAAWWATPPCSTGPQKSVVRGAVPLPPQAALVRHRADSYEVMRRFVAFEADPSAAKIPGLLLAAVRH